MNNALNKFHRMAIDTFQAYENIGYSVQSIMINLFSYVCYMFALTFKWLFC